MKLGWIGLGKMGRPMSQKLIEAGFDLTVYNRTKARVSEYDQVAESIDELVKQVDVVIMMVSDDAAVEEIFNADNGVVAGLTKGKIIVNMSTISPEVSRSMDALCKVSEAYYVDAPVSGSVKQAEEASLVAIVGGEVDIVEKVKPILNAMTKATVHIGAVGAGNAAKLAVNTFLGVVTQGLAEAIQFSNAMNVKTEDLLGILNNSALGSPYIKIKGDAVVNDNYQAAFTLEHLAKDLRLAKESGLKGEVSLTTHDNFQKANESLGAEDVMSIIKYLK